MHIGNEICWWDLPVVIRMASSKRCGNSVWLIWLNCYSLLIWSASAGSFWASKQPSTLTWQPLLQLYFKVVWKSFAWEFVFKVELRAEIKREWPAVESRLGWELCPGKGLWSWHLWHKQRPSSALNCWGSLCSPSVPWLRLVLDTETTRRCEEIVSHIS